METGFEMEQEIRVSDRFYEKIRKVWNEASGEDRAKLLNPDIIRYDPNFYVIEKLGEIVSILSGDRIKARELFLDTRDLVSTGHNPFRDKQLEKAGVDPVLWKRALKMIQEKKRGLR